MKQKKTNKTQTKTNKQNLMGTDNSPGVSGGNQEKTGSNIWRQKQYIQIFQELNT